MNHFVQRTAEMLKLEQLLVEIPSMPIRRKIAVLHGLGGNGKTQLAAQFAREQHHRFSAIFWLDGSSKISLEKSLADLIQRLPPNELTDDGVKMLEQSSRDVDLALRECMMWLSLPSNHSWLMIFDNVDRDHNDRGDPQAYNVKDYFPDADHGSILITSRLVRLQRQGTGIKVETVSMQQAREILEHNAGRKLKGNEMCHLRGHEQCH